MVRGEGRRRAKRTSKEEKFLHCARRPRSREANGREKKPADSGRKVQLTGQLVQGFAGLVELGELFFFGAEFGGVRD